MTQWIEPNVFQLDRADSANAAPLVVDSPHSGTIFPDDFGTVVPLNVLRKVQDSYVDELFGQSVEYGASLLRALFPRSYIDPNRAEDDLDIRLLSRSWPNIVRPSEKTRLGHGLIWRTCPTDRAMYDRRLSPEEVNHRLDAYWRPYHSALEEEIIQRQAQFGTVWHLNCHSMPAGSSPIIARSSRTARADFVLGDKDGRSCDPAFSMFVRDWLVGRGYSVRLNDPYKGAYLVEAYSNPAEGRHSLQIEINRALYMDEITLQKLNGFDALRDDLGDLIRNLAEELRSRTLATAAE